MGIDRSRAAFLRDTVAHTSAYLGKAILINLLEECACERVVAETGYVATRFA